MVIAGNLCKDFICVSYRTYPVFSVSKTHVDKNLETKNIFTRKESPVKMKIKLLFGTGKVFWYRSR